MTLYLTDKKIESIEINIGGTDISTLSDNVDSNGMRIDLIEGNIGDTDISNLSDDVISNGQRIELIESNIDGTDISTLKDDVYDIQTNLTTLENKPRFFAMSNSLDYFVPNGRVSYDYTQYDCKGNFDRTTGTFTASEDGLHAFFFSGRLGAPYGINDKYLDVFVNGNKTIEFRWFNSQGYSYWSITEFWTLELKQGDTVYMNSRDGNVYVTYEKPMFFAGYFIN